MEAAEREIYDHRLIRRHGGSAPFLPGGCAFRASAVAGMAGRQAQEPHDGPTLIVTHHVPHLTRCHPHHGLNALAPAFCSDCDDWSRRPASAGAAAWIFGRHHWSHRLEVHGMKLLAAQPGYPGEDTGWTDRVSSLLKAVRRDRQDRVLVARQLKKINYANRKACRDCPLRARCTDNQFRTVSRLENEAVLDRMQERLAKRPEVLNQRRETVEHPFGSIKQWMNQGAFLMRGLEKVRAEFSLTALAYNIRRVLNLIAFDKLMAAVKAAPG